MSDDALVRCPANSMFLACSEFVGCCVSQTCPCQAQDIRPMQLGDLFSPTGVPRMNLTGIATCDPNSSALWYTCAATRPTYQGCCQVNPCSNNGCGSPNGAIPVAGQLENLQKLLGTSATNQVVEGSGNSASASTTSTASAGSPTGTANTQSSPAQTPSLATSKQLPAGAVAGIVIGVVAIIALAVLGGIFLWRRKPKTQEQARPETRFSEAGTMQGYAQDDIRGHYGDLSKPGFPNSPQQSSFVGSSQSFDHRGPHHFQTDGLTLRSSSHWSQYPEHTPAMSQSGWSDHHSQQQPPRDDHSSFQGIGELPAHDNIQPYGHHQELQGDIYHANAPGHEGHGQSQQPFHNAHHEQQQ